MAIYSTQESKDKAIGVAEANVERLTKTKEKAETSLARVTKQLRVAELDLEHRKSAPILEGDDDLLEGLEA